MLRVCFSQEIDGAKMSILTQFGRVGSSVTADLLPLTKPAVWTVLQTKSRQEKALAGDLSAKGVQHYLPLIKKTQFYGGRRFVVDLPLFPGYIFLFGTLDEVYSADRTRRVAKIIEVYDQGQLEQELTNLRLATEGSELLLPYPFLKKGVRVEVRSGPFRGLQGLVEQRAGAHRLILQIEMLGRAVSLEIGAAELDVID
jgi:transcription antitermination factor NusG